MASREACNTLATVATVVSFTSGRYPHAELHAQAVQQRHQRATRRLLNEVD